MADDETLLLSLGLSDSDNDSRKGSGDPSNSSAAPKRDKHFQSEADFQKIKDEYYVKTENGELWKTINLPLGASVSKPEMQSVLHAVEELYFFARFDEAIGFIQRVLEPNQSAHGMDDDAVNLLRAYETKCRQKKAAWAANNSPGVAGSGSQS